MSQKLLIDGYNLLHVFGLPSGRLTGRGLEKARAKMLDWLVSASGQSAPETTVVFDCHRPRPGSKGEEQHQGLQVLYAIRHDEADDLMEELIRKHSSPRQLTVVSDDHRVQRAGRRRHCRVLSCNEFLDSFEQRGSSTDKANQSNTDVKDSGQDDKSRWLQVFGDLDKGPEMRELFGWLDFDDDGKRGD
jgi:predicted RNA-binding protein with PIN domain